MIRARHHALLKAAATGIALGAATLAASTIAYAQREAPPIPPGSIPNAAPVPSAPVPKETPKVITPDSVVGAPRETTPPKSEAAPKRPRPKPVARPKQTPPAAAQP
ncbi:MAG: hypothetical protein K2Y71_00005, partial [Xanthobacteraceae bacterium]|nr:hypothetical protein [Xanthobacteraceae bacterium]